MIFKENNTIFLYSVDPEGDDVLYYVDWDDGTTSGWVGPYASGLSVECSHQWSEPGVYYVKAEAKDVYGALSEWSEPLMVIIENIPPSIPTISGTVNGKIGTSYPYIFISTDPDGADVSYFIDWGDETNSGWIGPYASGEEQTMSHTWDTKGDYMIQVKARDNYNAESDWGTLTVTMPFSYEPSFPFIQWLFECFPNAFPILRHMMGY